MPLMVTFFNVRKGRDTIFKRGMRHVFPRTARADGGEVRHPLRRLVQRDRGIDLEQRASSWTCRTTRCSTSSTPIRAMRGFGHRVAESVFDKKHTIFLRERMGPDFVFKP